MLNIAKVLVLQLFQLLSCSGITTLRELVQNNWMPFLT